MTAKYRDVVTANMQSLADWNGRVALIIRRHFPRFPAFNRAFLTQFAKDKCTRPLSESYLEIVALVGRD